MVSFRDCRVDCRRERLRGRLKIIRTLPCLTGKSRDKPQISQIAQNLPAGSGRAIIRNPPLRAAVFAARQSQEEGDCLPLRGTEGGGMSAARHFSARYGKEQTHERRKTYKGGDMRPFLVDLLRKRQVRRVRKPFEPRRSQSPQRLLKSFLSVPCALRGEICWKAHRIRHSLKIVVHIEQRVAAGNHQGW
mgnify:CR=1 FL=1